MDLDLVRDIKTAEGFSLTAYKDSLGLWTIGYGHLMDQTKDWTGFTTTQNQADGTLIADITNAQTKAEKLSEWSCLDTPCRQNAVIELVFNMGDKWKQFAQTRLDIQNKNWQKAHDDLLDSLWAKQVGAVRSTRLARYLLTGRYV
jgi:lysozyme